MDPGENICNKRKILLKQHRHDASACRSTLKQFQS